MAALSSPGSMPGGENGQHFQWQVNGQDVGVDSAGYSTAGLINGDEVVCQVSSSDVCAKAVSVPIAMTVKTVPLVR